jgi:hypothetical protein
MNIDSKLAQLQCTFPKLTEANQHYMLGIAEGLKRAQKGKVGEKDKKSESRFRETDRK